MFDNGFICRSSIIITVLPPTRGQSGTLLAHASACTDAPGAIPTPSMVVLPPIELIGVLMPFCHDVDIACPRGSGGLKGAKSR